MKHTVVPSSFFTVMSGSSSQVDGTPSVPSAAPADAIPAWEQRPCEVFLRVLEPLMHKPGMIAKELLQKRGVELDTVSTVVDVWGDWKDPLTAEWTTAIASALNDTFKSSFDDAGLGPTDEMHIKHVYRTISAELKRLAALEKTAKAAATPR